MKGGGGGGGAIKRNTSIEQGMQVSTTTQRAATTTMHCHTEILITKLRTYHGQPRGREGEGKTVTQMHNLVLEMEVLLV